MSHEDEPAFERIGVTRRVWLILYLTFFSHLPDRPRYVRSWRTSVVSRFAPGVSRYANINRRASIGFGAEIAERAGVGRGSCVPSGVSLGSHVTMGPEVMFIVGDHPIPPRHKPFRSRGPVTTRIFVGEDAFIGARATILPGVRIGDGAVIGAGSVVTRDVQAFTVVAGNPARVLRVR